MTDTKSKTAAPKAPDKGAVSATPEAAADSTSANAVAGDPYRVLARKHRPQSFAELVGQDALVRTLTNAIARDRIAHAFMLTGVRGIGKTSTARIFARALNCIGPDGKGGPTVSPCGACEHCVAIAEDRHMDVIEMDAASHTGVDNMRELIESARYRPTSARFKLYIIDEVHMLSASAFNALLKTLEEPPEHVKFVLATTEIRKVPVTVLSRCQRFDLKRLDRETLTAHLANIAEKENADIEDAAMAMIVRAADGSVRDGLSLLDQAIALGDNKAGGAAGGKVTGDAVRGMLGLADQARILDLFDLLIGGKIADALALAGELYRSGADPVVIVQDLLDLSHWLTRLKIVPDAAEGLAVSEAERDRATAMAGKLAMPALARAWQMLLKGLAEVQTAHAPLTALEMALVRLAYAAELPTPGAIVEALESEKLAPGQSTQSQPAKPADPPARIAAPPEPPRAVAAAGRGEPRPALVVETENPAPETAPEPAPPGEAALPDPLAADVAPPDPRSFDEVVALFQASREAMLFAHLKKHVHLVRFAPQRIEFRPADGAPETLANRIGSLLTEWTGQRWVVSVSQDEGAPTLAEQEAATDAARRRKAASHPLVKAALEAFPGAAIEAVRTLPEASAPPPDGAPPADADTIDEDDEA
ncbi:MAG TPA: DNA polymerase III subunit gamma/tau [Alphaproteobacteria bacterium]|nr:DNA polymerase III subunit gamma/tau [Alphaproteobacteria bacterium]